MTGTLRAVRGLAMMICGGGIMFTTGCLPENFWAGKWGEVVNRSIFGAINAVVGAVTNGAIQL